MAHYTQLSERHVSKCARNSRNHTSSDEEGLSTDVLLSQLQEEFDKDEARMSQNILFYQDVVIEDRKKPGNKVRFFPEQSKSVLDDEQWNPPSRMKYPPTPAKPSPSTIARMMDISYTSWSSSSYDDTTADSKLADWLASFAEEENTSVKVNTSTRNPFIIRATEVSSCQTPGNEEPTRPRSLAAGTLHSRRRATPWNPHHRRAVSQPSYSTSSWFPSSPALPFLQTTPNRARTMKLEDEGSMG
ncbi:652_t:CDS:1, partial [Acaulospora colombiana]